MNKLPHAQVFIHQSEVRPMVRVMLLIPRVMAHTLAPVAVAQQWDAALILN